MEHTAIKIEFDNLEKIIPLMLTIYGNVPSKNSSRQLIWNKRTGRPMIISSKETIQYEKDFAIQIRKEYKNRFSKDDRLEIKIDWYASNYRSDIDNIPKVILDCLQKNEVIYNDNKIDKLVIQRYLDKDNPRVEIIIKIIN